MDEYDDVRQVKLRRSPKAPATEQVLIRDVVLRFAVKISKSLKIFGALFPWLIVPMFRYLTHEQLQELKMLPTERRRAEQLLIDLKLEGEDCDSSPKFCKFVASLCVEGEHMGHQDIARELKAALPPPERSKIQDMADKGYTPSRRVNYGMTIKEFVQSLSPEICKYLKMKGALSPLLCTPELSFLTPHQLQELYRVPSEKAVAEELLLLLDTAEELSFCKFVGCLLMEPEHRGHREIVKCLIEIMQSLQNIEMPQLLVCIELKGDIVGKEFVEIDRSLWEMFAKKKYAAVIQQAQSIRLDSTAGASIDRKIVASSFEAVTLVHQGTAKGNFQKAITHLLLPALKLCEKSENSLILQGRICLRMAQIYLQMKQPDVAEVYFGIAKGSLFLSGRGYDKFKMFCREAKLLTVSEPEERKKIDRLFDAALDNISGNEPYASTCTESVLLSKAALYLNISFGTAESNFSYRQPSPDDITKARRILSFFDKKRELTQLNNMRECEYLLLTAELLRLEGDRDRAFTIFDGLSRGITEHLNRNVVEIAKHRCSILK